MAFAFTQGLTLTGILAIGLVCGRLLIFLLERD